MEAPDCSGPNRQAFVVLHKVLCKTAPTPIPLAVDLAEVAAIVTKSLRRVLDEPGKRLLPHESMMPAASQDCLVVLAATLEQCVLDHFVHALLVELGLVFAIFEHRPERGAHRFVVEFHTSEGRQ